MKTIFFDRDGTINIDHNFVHRIEDFEFEEKVKEAFNLLKEERLFVLTNQSGIGRGIFEESDMLILHRYMLQKLSDWGIKVEEIFFSPDLPQHYSRTRKPSPYYILQASKKYGFSLNETWMIGDRWTDIATAKNAGCRSVFLLKGHGERDLEKAKRFEPDFIAKNLLEAAEFIQNQ